MSNTSNNIFTFIPRVFGDEFLRNVLDELGVADAPEDVQEAALVIVGEMLYKSVVLQILIALPKGRHDEFERIAESGDAKKMQTFLGQHIPDFEGFLLHEITKAYEEIKTHIREISQEDSSEV